jgi:hypothetical protein
VFFLFHKVPKINCVLVDGKKKKGALFAHQRWKQKMIETINLPSGKEIKRKRVSDLLGFQICNSRID